MATKQLWVVATLILFQGWLCYSCIEEERSALLQFKASIDYPYPYPLPDTIDSIDYPYPYPAPYTIDGVEEASSFSDWVEDGNCCNWKRVRCNSRSGRITMLNLYLSRDSRDWAKDWYLNTSLFISFKEIKVLNLSFNGIAGVVENNGFERLSVLNHLEHLDLGDNRFNGSILSSLGALSSLKTLNLRFNRIEGSVEKLNNLTSLRRLDLHHNAIEGFRSSQGREEALKLKNLVFLDLGSNGLDRSVLSNLSGLESLIYLYLDNNQIKGSINVTELNALRNLEKLHLNNNEIYQFVNSTGDEGILQLSNLDYLGLGNNSFNNDIFPSLRELSSLSYLDLGHNQLKGTINMKALDRLSNLGELSLSGNIYSVKIVGSQGRSNLTNLKTIDLSYIKFEGTIFVQEFQNFAGVENLYMNYSSLDKDAFQSLGSLPFLKTLSLLGAQVTLPEEGMPSLKNLENLDLSNSITNSFLIMETIGRMPSLKYLDLSNCGLSGIIPTTTQGLCQLKHLQELHMGNNDLSGMLPSCLAELTSLQVLDLSFNHLDGNISSSPLKNLTSIQLLQLSYNHFQIPISLVPFFNLTQLKSLQVEDNEIYGEIENHGLTPKFQLEDLYLSGHNHGPGGSFPEFLYHQRALQFLDLSHANIKGDFPHWLLDNNTNLDTLYLVNNSLSGPLQLPIHPHLNLTDLDISINLFYGQIPPTIASYLPGLRFLNMSKNNFNGSIPSLMDLKGSLFSLDLSNNQLQDRIPEYFAKTCSLLDTLILSNNSIIGGIPMSLSSCSNLRMLDVSNNCLSGHIPEWIGNMSHLEFLDLSQNDFFGALSDNFNPPSLQYVYLSRNHLQGSLTKVFYDCSQLTTLDLSHNNFTGDIPDWIILLSELSFLLLSYNNLEGEIPMSLCKLHKLSFVDLSHNIFSGQIPYCLIVRPISDRYTSQKETTNFGQEGLSEESPKNILVNLPPPPPPPPPPFQSQSQTLVFTAKNASYAYHGRILQYMSGIDLSCNNLNDVIPHEFGNLRDIKVLNLSHNNLVGQIPPEFSNLREIETLDLSFNNLNGSIPLQLTRLYSLSAFSVAHNNLSGKIPDRVAQFATFEEGSYKDNPFLCGPPLAKSCNEEGTSSTSTVPKDATGNEEKNELVDMDAFWITFAVSYGMALLTVGVILYINPQWRRTLFYLAEQSIASCYYFVVDNFSFLSKLGLS